MSLEFHILDVFTDTAFVGNPLAVVLGADGLTGGQMQTIAREFNLSETIFVMAPRDRAHTARVRIFFPAGEIPFAGHPTIGCAIHLAGATGTRITLEEEAGLVPVTIRRDGSGGTVAELTAPVVPVRLNTPVDPALLAAALSLQPDDLGPMRPAVCAGGPQFLFVPLRSLDALARARPAYPHWPTVMRACDVDSAYLFTPGPDGSCDYRARMFSPDAGIPEDPATGSATALLAALLHHEGAVPHGTSRLVLHQGVEMGRPSHLTLTIDRDGPDLRTVRIAGSAVPVASGRIRIPGEPLHNRARPLPLPPQSPYP